MNIQSEPFCSAPREYVEACLARVVASLQPGWVLLRDCVLPGVDGKPPATLRALMMHPNFGVVLLDVMPGSTTPQAADRLRRLLELGHFKALHGGCPPIVYFCVPARTLPELGLILRDTFQAQDPPGLLGGAAWVDAVQAILAGIPQPTAPEATAPVRPGTEASPRASNQNRPGGPGVAQQGRAAGRRVAFAAGLVLLALGGGLAGWPYLGLSGPPGGAPPSRENVVDGRPDAVSMLPIAPNAGALADQALRPLARTGTPNEVRNTSDWETLTKLDGDLQIILAESAGIFDKAKEIPVDLPAPAAQPAEAPATPPPAATPSGDLQAAPPALPDPEAAPQPAADVPARLADAVTSSPSAVTPGVAPRAMDLSPVQAKPFALGQQSDASSAELLPGPDTLPATLTSPPEPPAPAPLNAASAHPVEAARAEAARRDTVPPAMPEPPVPHPAKEALEQPSAGRATTETKAVAAHAAPPTEENEAVPVTTTHGPGGPSPQPIVAASGGDTAAAVPLATPPAALSPQDRQPTEAAERPAPGASTTMIAVLLHRGNSMVLNADISGARRLYRPAADAGSGEAALALGKTYDPHFLRESGARGMEGDKAAAIAWYRRALSLGIGEARSQLARLGVAPGD